MLTLGAQSVVLNGAKYGAIAGAIATWSISSILALIEAGMGLPIGAFYTIIGIALGMDNVITASYFGFGLHILIGTLMGALVGAAIVRLVSIQRNFGRYGSWNHNLVNRISSDYCFSCTAFNGSNCHIIGTYY